MRPVHVHIWGFPDNSCDDWPSDLAPVVEHALTFDHPVVVHGAAIEEFQHASLADVTESDRLSTAILYVPTGASVPKGSWAYFDATVQEGDWQSLRDMLACPKRFESAAVAFDLPASVVARIRQPIQDLTLTQLPVSVSMRGHLVTCDSCRRAFADALGQRLRLRSIVFDPVVAPVVSVQREEPWLRAPLRSVFAPSTPLAVRSDHRDFMARWSSTDLLESVGAILRGLFQVQLFPTAALARRAVPGVSKGQTRFDAVWNRLISGEDVDLERPYRGMKLAWNASEQCIRIGDLCGDQRTPVKDFRLILSKAGETLWETDSESGHAILPLSSIRNAVANGADELVIETPE